MPFETVENPRDLTNVKFVKSRDDRYSIAPEYWRLCFYRNDCSRSFAGD